MLQAVVACLLFSSANCVRLGKRRAYMKHVPASNDDLRQECQGKTQQWSSEGGGRRLEGPAFFFHVNHHNGRGFRIQAARYGGYRTRGFTRWSEVDDVKAGRTITSGAADHGYQNDSMFKDKSWTDLEDTFEKHTLDELGCGPKSPRIFVTAARHPVENLLSREAFLQTQKYGLMGSCESDNIALRLWAGNVCGSKQHDDCRALTRQDLEIAKARARKMDAIFVLEHPATFQLGCTRLGWTYCPMYPFREVYSSDILDQLDNQSWTELFERNKLGIEFYDYLKQLSFDMLKEDMIPLPTKEEQDKALSVLRSLKDAKASAVPLSPKTRDITNASSTRWQCR